MADIKYGEDDMKSWSLIVAVHIVRLLSVVLVSLFCVYAIPASAQTWIGPTTDNLWSNAANWDTGLPGPTGTARIINFDDGIVLPADVVRTTPLPSEDWVIFDTISTIDRMRIGADNFGGDGELHIVGGTLTVLDGDDGAFELGDDDATDVDGDSGFVVQTGGDLILPTGGIKIGKGINSDSLPGGPFDGGFGFASYTISGGSIDADDRIVVGELDGTAIMTIIGSAASITSNTRFEVESNGILRYELDSAGVTPITVTAGDGVRFREPDGAVNPGAMIEFDFSALTSTIGDILLVDNQTFTPIGGGGAFANAPEGSVVSPVFGDGSFYTVSYVYNSPTTADPVLNDFALIANIPTLAGDFDEDGDVDGGDFLKWQRGELSPPLDPTDLADWQSNFGSPGPLSSVASVPEPTTLALLLLGGLSLFRMQPRTNTAN